tara:strand:+ start:3131 stop:3568 length:438 start_codon:yes stop_codon:yes gene_type:complete
MWFVMLLLIASTVILVSWSVPIVEANTSIGQQEREKINTLLLNSELNKNKMEFDEMNDNLTEYLSNTKLLNSSSSQKIDQTVESETDAYLDSPTKLIGGANVGNMLTSMVDSTGKSYLEFSTMLNYHLNKIHDNIDQTQMIIKSM